MITQERNNLVLAALCVAEQEARRFAARMLRGMALVNVDDAQQEAAVALLGAAAKFDPARGKPFAAFARRVVRRVVRRRLIDWWRRKEYLRVGVARSARRRRHSGPAEFTHVAPWVLNSVPFREEAPLRWWEGQAAGLTELERCVIELWLVGTPWREMAERLGCPKSTLHSYRRCALDKLRRVVEAEREAA